MFEQGQRPPRTSRDRQTTPTACYYGDARASCACGRHKVGVLLTSKAISLNWKCDVVSSPKPELLGVLLARWVSPGLNIELRGLLLYSGRSMMVAWCVYVCVEWSPTRLSNWVSRGSRPLCCYLSLLHPTDKPASLPCTCVWCVCGVGEWVNWCVNRRQVRGQQGL